MGKNKKIFLVLFMAAFCIICLISNLGSFSKVKLFVPENTPELSEVGITDMVSRYKSGEISVINISAITTFAWDRLYFFGNYTSPEEVDSVVGEEWRNLDSCESKVLILESSDSYTLLVFTKNHIVVHCLAHPHVPYPFGLSKQHYGKPGFSPQEALFILNDSDIIVSKDSK